MPRWAITIGSYRMPEFIALQIATLRHVFGRDVDILVSDDWSDKSAEIRELCAKQSVYYLCSETPRGHFAGDFMAILNSMAFAKSIGADIGIKISQRFVLVEPVVQEILNRHLSSPEIWLGLPGRISSHTIHEISSRFFANFPILSDILIIRTGVIAHEVLKDIYEGKCKVRATPMAGFVELVWQELKDTIFSNRYVILTELTHPFPGRAKLFLRRYQSLEAEYAEIALKHGINPVRYRTDEWRRLSASYRPVPQFS